MDGKMEEILLKNWFEGFNNRDWEAVKSVYSDDVLVHTKNGLQKGSDAISSLGKKWIKAIPDAKIVPLYSSVEKENLIVVHWKVEGIFAESIQGMNPSGEKVVFHGHTCFRFYQGKVVEHWASVDYRPLQANKVSEAHTVQVILEAKVGKENELKEALMSVANQSRAEESCLEYRVYQDGGNPSHFGLFEKWKNKEVHQEQFTKSYIVDFSKRSEELLASPYKAVIGEECLVS